VDVDSSRLVGAAWFVRRLFLAGVRKFAAGLSAEQSGNSQTGVARSRLPRSSGTSHASECSPLFSPCAMAVRAISTSFVLQASESQIPAPLPQAALPLAGSGLKPRMRQGVHSATGVLCGGGWCVQCVVKSAAPVPGLVSGGCVHREGPGEATAVAHASALCGQ
jgi:hypothetical protein